MKICFTGDSIMLTRPSSAYWKNNALLSSILECDIRASNLEMSLSSNKSFASTYCGGLWLTTDPDILNDLNKYGFQYYNTANNHTMDYSYDGMLETLKILDYNGILHSGSGCSLKDASKPVYYKLNDTKIAFLSCTASCDDAARAGDESYTIPARPGVSMLRHNEILYVTRENIEIIDKIAKETNVNARFLKSVKMGIHNLSPEIHRLGRLQFIEANENKKMTYCYKNDLDRIIKQICIAKENTDYVFVSVHSHDIKGDTDDTPDYYLEEFAHKCIDHGASAVVGTGTHQLKGIEIYKESPIFYSLGNFINKMEHMDYAPSDYYYRYGVDLSQDTDIVWLKRSKNNTIGLEFDPMNYRSVVPIMKLKSGKIINVSLIPIELGFDGGEFEKGFPYLAKKEYAEEICHRLNKLSEIYDTKLSLMDDGKIYIR